MTSSESCINPAHSRPLLALRPLRRPRGCGVAQPSIFPEDDTSSGANMFQNIELASSRHLRPAKPPGRPPLKMSRLMRRLVSAIKKGAKKGKIADHEKFI
jgi:hypothetical protein